MPEDKVIFVRMTEGELMKICSSLEAMASMLETVSSNSTRAGELECLSEDLRSGERYVMELDHFRSSLDALISGSGILEL